MLFSPNKHLSLFVLFKSSHDIDDLIVQQRTSINDPKEIEMIEPWIGCYETADDISQFME